MNCKEGDLAIFVGSGEVVAPRVNGGKIVRCVALLGVVKFRDGEEHKTWQVEGSPLIDVDGCNTNLAPDEWLRPIRDNDGEDEMLRIAGKPQRVTA